MADRPDDHTLREILGSTRVIAVVGFSPNPDRPSYVVAQFLAQRGYRVIPVNPGHSGAEFFGETVRASLTDIPRDIAVDMVDVFRRSEAVPGIVEEALAHLPGLRTVWMQIGVESADAAATATARGIRVVQDACPKIEYQRLFGTQPMAGIMAG